MNELFYKYSEAEDFAKRLFQVVNTNVYIHEVGKVGDSNYAKYIVSQEKDLMISADSVGKIVKIYRKG